MSKYAKFIHAIADGHIVEKLNNVDGQYDPIEFYDFSDDEEYRIVHTHSDGIEGLRAILYAQAQDGTRNVDNYMVGLYNGLELAMSQLERRKPEFKECFYDRLEPCLTKGLSRTHLEQLLLYCNEIKERGEYYGNKNNFFKRHDDIVNYLESLVLNTQLQG